MNKRVTRFFALSMMLFIPCNLEARSAVLADFDKNGKVEFADFLKFAQGYGYSETKYDLDGNGSVDFQDFLIFAQFFGQTINRISFKRGSGYFVSNKFPDPNPTNFVLIENRETWEAIFLSKPPPFDPAERTEINFNISSVMAIIKWGNSYWSLNIDNVSLSGSALTVEYKAECTRENMTWTAAVPEIGIVDKQKITSVVFVENGLFMKKIEIK